MPQKKIFRYLPFIYALIFTGLFYKQQMGLNLLIAQCFFVVYLLMSRSVKLGKNLASLIFTAYCVTGISAMVNFTVLAYLVHWLSFALLIGSLALQSAHSLPHAIISFFFSAFKAPYTYIKTLKANSELGTSHVYKKLKKLVLFLVPLLIIGIFIILYRISNPKFDAIVSSIFSWIETPFDWFIKNLNFGLIFTFILCLFISIIALTHSQSNLIRNALLSYSDSQIRRRKTWPIFKFNGLKNEHASALFLFIGLNIILLIVNIIDINWVWIQFEWTGQYLKQFVHEGTYILIFSIFISFSLVLYFFRNNLSFYSKNTFLKKLSVIWLAQNMVLSISVAIRNYHYIQHFALAYKRIAVLVFLILTLTALVVVMIKVLKNKSLYYTMRINTWSLFLALVLSSLFPWDSIIINYNFSQKNKAFIHLDFLSTLENKNVHLLEKSMNELNQIKLFNDQKAGNKKYYMSSQEYHQKIEAKKHAFIDAWESKNWLSWNFAEYQAYQRLTSKAHLRP